MAERVYPVVCEPPGSGVVYVSGAAGVDEQDRPVVGDDHAVYAAMRVALGRLQAVGLEAAHIAKITYFLADIRMRETVNEHFAACFPDRGPARTVVAVHELPLGARALIDVVAHRPSSDARCFTDRATPSTTEYKERDA